MKDINDKHDKTIDMQLYPLKFKKKKILLKKSLLKKQGFYLTKRFLSNEKVFRIENRLKKNKELKSE